MVGTHFCAPTIFELDISLFRSLRLLDCYEVPNALLGVCGLNECRVTVCVAGLVEGNIARDAAVLNIGQGCHDGCGIRRACCLDGLDRYHVCIVAHDGDCCEHVVAAVLLKASRVGVHPLLNALFEIGIAALGVEGGDIQLGVLAYGCLDDGVVIPSVGAEQRNFDALCVCLLNDELCVLNGYGSEDGLCAFLLCVVQVRSEVGVILGEGLGDDLDAELIGSFLEVIDKALVVVVAKLAEAVDGVGLELLFGKVCVKGALETDRGSRYGSSGCYPR